MEILRTDLVPWEIGPYHSALPGPMKLALLLDGEVIVKGTAETGFLHRGLEKAIENHPWVSTIAYSDHLDPEGAVFGELALCLAVEELASIEVPPRALAIRLILSELGRISSHLGFVARSARAVGSSTMFHYVLRDREKVLDLFELLTGSRFSVNFLRFGGVTGDVTEGFIERVLEACDVIQIRLKEYNDLLSFNRSFMKRTSGVGVISQEQARKLGVTGPNARACGLAFDARKAHPYSGFDRIDFEVPVSPGPGDAHERYLLRLREIAQSVGILKQILDRMPEGDFLSLRVGLDHKMPAGEAYSRIESSRGLLGCHVVSDGGTRPCRVQFRVPSGAHLAVVPELLPGIRIEDLPVVLASLDIGVSEADR